MNTTNTTESNKGVWWVLSALIFFVILISVVFFQHQSLRLDEAQSLWQTSRTPMKIIEIIGKDVHVPFYHLLLHGWQAAFGNGVVTARIFSLIFFILCIPSIYFLGRRIFNNRVALFATILFTISPFMNWYGNEIRMYSLFVFLTLLNTYFFMGIYKHGDQKSWIGFGVTAAFGIYCHYFFFLVLLADAVFYLLYRHLFKDGTFKKLATTAVVLGVLFAPWVLNVYLLRQATNSVPGLTPPSSINIFNTFSQFVFGFQTDHLNTIILSLWPLTIFLGFLALRKNKDIKPETIYLAILFILPNIAAFIISFVMAPVYLSRYLIFTLPAMYLLLSWVLHRYTPGISLIGKSLLVVVMIVMLAFEGLSATNPVKENYREAAQFLEAEAEQSDIIVVSAPFTIYPMVYYYRGPLAIKTLPLWDQNAVGPIPPYDEGKLAEDLEKIKENHANMWVLLSYDQGYEEKLRIYLDTHLERNFEMNFAPKMNLYRYKLRYE